MIYTCTMNPAIDLFTEFKNFEPFIVNRSIFEDYQANGKAINISFILKQMGIDSVALGFLAGFTGDFIEQELTKKGIQTDFVHVPGITRINTFIRAGKLEYKAVNQGPEIAKKYQTELLKQMDQLEKDDILFVSGSLPQGVDDQIFVEISKRAKKNEFRVIFDISSEVLVECLSDKPYLIKPNEEELVAFVGVEKLTEISEIETAAKTLLKKGAEGVLVSIGAQGALFLNEHESYFANAPKGKVVNTACAGDTLLAAFVGKRLQQASLQEALKYAVAAGSATAFTAGLGDLTDLDALLDQIEVISLRREY